MNSIILNKSIITENGPLYFIADIGANHDGSLDRAYKLIELAKESGANAAKFQNFQAEKIVSNVGFQSLGQKMSHQSSWNKSVFEIYQDASVSFDWTEKLKLKCDEVGIEYFTSPYDFESVDSVDPFVDIYKIGSGDITWIEIVEYISKKRKPVLLATGASQIEDVKRAMDVILKHTNDVVLMQCNTNYTGSNDNFNYLNLNVLKLFKELYPNVILGLSDHTEGDVSVLGSIALGARVIEKHFTDDNSRIGPDHKFAMNPKSWMTMVERSNQLLSSLGDGVKRVEPNEEKSLIVQRRSIRAAKDMSIGHVLCYEDLEFLRPIPNDGINPYEFNTFIGKKLTNSISKGEHFKLSNFDL